MSLDGSRAKGIFAAESCPKASEAQTRRHEEKNHLGCIEIPSNRLRSVCIFRHNIVEQRTDRPEGAFLQIEIEDRGRGEECSCGLQHKDAHSLLWCSREPF